MKLKEEMDVEAEVELQISDYIFHDRSGRPVSFAVLPFGFHEDENTSPVPALRGQVFLRGNCSSSLRWVLKAVVAWKLDLNAIYVLSSGGQWMRISKPIKAYQNGEARSILIAVHMLKYIRRKPGSSMIKFLIHLNRVLRLEAKPIMADFDEHMVLIRKIFNNDKVLRNSKLSEMFLKVGTRKETVDEVFLCWHAARGQFYHPKCTARLLKQGTEAETNNLQKKIAAGRCPKLYHRHCLSRAISFKDIEDEGVQQRAWEGLLPRHIMLYCCKHEIDVFLRTPIRNH